MSADDLRVGLRLPLRFDAHRLKADLALVSPAEWTRHYNLADYEGNWRGAALRSSTGEIGNLIASRLPVSNFKDTPLMERCSYFREAVAGFECPVRVVRLLSLGPGSFIREHTDNALGYEDGEMRIHIPVQTAPELEFYVDGERVLLEEGFTYYVNVNLPHRITNRTASERIHLIIDIEVNEWVHKLVRQARAQKWAIARAAPPSRSFDDFASLVFDDPALLERLHSITNREEFIAASVRAAQERGFEVCPGDVDAALHVDRTNDPPKRRIPPLAPTPSKPGWCPAAVHFRGNQPFLEWIYTGTRRLTKPFFEETLRDSLELPFTAAFRRESRLDTSEEFELPGALEPTGIIFHGSRCGSTLVAQMLAALDGTIVVSEPPLLDQVLQAHLRLPPLSFDEQVRWVRRVILALGQQRTGTEAHYLLKVDSWHVHRLPLLRAAFPKTPRLFLFRKPIEVLHSHALQPGLQALPGAIGDPGVLGLTWEDLTRLSADEWCARVLANIYAAALEYVNDPQVLFVEYADLPEAVYGSIARHFGMCFDDAALALMRERACLHSKNGSPWPRAGSEPLDLKRMQSLQHLCAQVLAPLYQQLRRAATRKLQPD